MLLGENFLLGAKFYFVGGKIDFRRKKIIFDENVAFSCEKLIF